MPRIFHDDDAPLTPLDGKRVAVVGYGNQGRSWALNLRDSGVDVLVGTISDGSRANAQADGFDAHEIPDAVEHADVVCMLIPDEVMTPAFNGSVAPALRDTTAVCFASGYALTFDEALVVPDGRDVMLIAPRMIGVGVRDCYTDGTGFIAFASVERDATGTAWPRCLAVARGIGATRRGVLELSAKQEALMDLFVEQAIAPALGKVWREAAVALLEQQIPLEAVLVEFYLSGEVERTYRALREMGQTRQDALHSETSQYGTLSRASRFESLDVAPRMRGIVDEILSGEFAKEWAAERAAGYPTLKSLRESDPRRLLTDFEDGVRASFEPPR